MQKSSRPRSVSSEKMPTATGLALCPSTPMEPTDAGDDEEYYPSVNKTGNGTGATPLLSSPRGLGNSAPPPKYQDGDFLALLKKVEGIGTHNNTMNGLVKFSSNQPVFFDLEANFAISGSADVNWKISCCPQGSNISTNKPKFQPTRLQNWINRAPIGFSPVAVSPGEKIGPPTYRGRLEKSTKISN